MRRALPATSKPRHSARVSARISRPFPPPHSNAGASVLRNVHAIDRLGV